MSLSTTNVWVVIPALNEATAITSVIRELKDIGLDQILVVDDGSDDDTSARAMEFGAEVVRHSVNLGTGSATETGFEYVRRFHNDADVVVTCDADGQHHAQDVLNVVNTLIEGDYDLVVGSRISRDYKSMPVVRLLGNVFVNLFIRATIGFKISDSQSGLRALSRKALGVMKLQTSGWEFLTEMIKIAKKNKLRVAETSIQAIYTPYSLTKVKDYMYVLNIVKYVIIRR